jgi:predicted nucleotidyltransferase
VADAPRPAGPSPVHPSGGYTEAISGILGDTVAALDDRRIDYLIFGSLASIVLARPRSLGPDEDVDVLVHPGSVETSLQVLSEAGFSIEEKDPAWIHKATRADRTVDLIHRVGRDIYLDDEMRDRAIRTQVLGVNARLISAEDLAVMKAMVHQEHRSSDWFDALAILRRTDLDWDYMCRRGGQHGPRRLLSLLLYVRSDGIPVPDRAFGTLRSTIR